MNNDVMTNADECQSTAMKTTSDVYFYYATRNGNTNKIKINGYHFDNEMSVEKFSPITIPEKHIRILRCRCGSNDWGEDGRYINEYCCNDCGQYITVY
ncbi:hypothetical protein KKJ06_22330 [Xenorhabdus bovienii]|uniref:hypothetical protein n=1 Tax=Xenorhabdus bovienii TaxID=40576 RepID=UPI0023B303AE|nr:hypothetical protein [Xenorhabdus bovienii]MDE9447405.1 hypothetical protein [Xenorhabdus bovienii]MDE9558032.1 hypothetical protein [Xenorhabdus bovienii]MDE9565121.1 hypothetical protein [Xenorhabdus bovienii]